MFSKEFNSVATVTLITFDTAIATDKKQVKRLGRDPDGWALFSGKEAQSFLTDFKKVYGEALEAVMNKKANKLRLGGSVFTTLYTLLEFSPSIERGASFVPVGTGNGLRGELDSLVEYVSSKREVLVTEMGERFSGRLRIEETPSAGITPVIVSFYQKGKRSMVLLRDEQEIRLQKKSLLALKPPSIFLVDTRELVQEGYKEAIHALCSKPETFTVVGLGTESILEKAIPDIKELKRKTSGAFGFSGNKGEVDVLVKHWDGIETISELMKAADISFILETNGQKGANLYTLLEGEVIKGSYKIPKKEIFYGDTTNAGDVFLAATLAGLMEFMGSAVDEKKLRSVLKKASQKTLKFLRSR